MLERSSEKTRSVNRLPSAPASSTAYDCIRLTSVATWTEGIPTLLPRTDRVHLGRLNDEENDFETSWLVPFEALLALPGALTKTSHWLPRWETGAFRS